MGPQEETLWQKRKSYAGKDGRLVHNAEATKTGEKQPEMTYYVNICNYSTPDVVEIPQKPTDI